VEIPVKKKRSKIHYQLPCRETESSSVRGTEEKKQTGGLGRRKKKEREHKVQVETKQEGRAYSRNALYD